MREMKSFFISGQENALSLTSRAVATVLHDRPELFNEDNQIDTSADSANDIYALPLPNYININGELSDWGEQAAQAKLFSLNDINDAAANDQFSVSHLLGYHGRFIYALFEVVDDFVLFRQTGFLRVDAADHIRLTLQDPGALARRYTLIAREPGRMSIYLMDEEWRYPSTGDPNYDLAAELSLTDRGYNVELRIPRFMLSSDTRIQLSVADVDDPDSLLVNAIVATTPQYENDDLSRVLVRSPEIAKILSGLDRSDSRIWVVGKDQKIRTVVGSIDTENELNQHDKPVNSGKTFDYAIAMVRYYYDSALRAVFNFIVEKQVISSVVQDDSMQQRFDQMIKVALTGNTAADRLPSINNQGTILVSAHPVFYGDDILGAVIVEQSTNSLLQQQQTILENVISVTLLVLLTVLGAILLFASRLTFRIRRLRNATDGAIDRDGKIINQKLRAEARSGDELGDLSRSVSNMLGRLGQYTNYLRGLPDTLAHEVSNPLNVVNSSLHNLALENPGISNSKYLERATNGVNRIGSILRHLTEAANLEQAMQSETREVFDLVDLIESYVDGYTFSNPDQQFELQIQAKPLMVEAAPDYIAQALDKLVDNAIDFAGFDTAIVFKLRRFEKIAYIDVINLGSSLPQGMAERIFEPLVSLGRKDAQKTRLGMGLYLVKLIASFHGGDVIARNLAGNDGVIFSFSLPIYVAEPPA